MRVLLAILASVPLMMVLASCSAPETLRVRQFHLRDTKVATGDRFIRAETNRRLHGAVSEEERALRLGNYYHMRWRGLSGTQPVRVVFEYRQVRTGALVKKVEAVAPASSLGKGKGDFEIALAGEDYQKNGRVLAWRTTLYEGESVVATKQSYLWD